MVRIRLKQQGRTKQKNYRIIVIESVKKRDGRTIEEIGFYNPITNPSTVTLNVEKYLGWIAKGAQPSDTVAVLYKNVFANK